MKITITNIGHVENANIDVNSITVIAGNNNTGKSTVGKSLYAAATGLNLLEPFKILEEKAQSIGHRLNSILRLLEIDGEQEDKFRSLRRYCLAAEFLELDDVTTAEEDDERFSIFIEQQVKDLIDDIMTTASPTEIDILERMQSNIMNLVGKSINDKNFKVNIMQKVFDMEFSRQISPLDNRRSISSIALKETNQEEIRLEFFEHKLLLDKTNLEISRPFSKVIYIDNPFILDTLQNRIGLLRNQYVHSEVLKSFLKEKDDIYNSNLFELDNIEGQIESIFNYILADGTLISKEGNNYYKNSLFETPLLVENLSTGLKSFSILYMLLKSNSLNKCEYIILDEPEIHLHPEWQLKFAELVVLISKQFNIKLIITSHSPYFVEAIELYSKKHNYFSDVKFYRTKINSKSKRYIIENVTENLKTLYEDLAGAFFELEELREEIEDRSSSKEVDDE